MRWQTASKKKTINAVCFHYLKISCPILNPDTFCDWAVCGWRLGDSTLAREGQAFQRAEKPECFPHSYYYHYSVNPGAPMDLISMYCQHSPKKKTPHMEYANPFQKGRGRHGHDFAAKEQCVEENNGRRRRRKSAAVCSKFGFKTLAPLHFCLWSTPPTIIISFSSKYSSDRTQARLHREQVCVSIILPEKDP